MLVGKGIEPENAHEDHFHNDVGGVTIERGYIVRAASAFLDGADASFNFGNVLVFAGDIERCVEAGGNVRTAALEFHVGVDFVYFEASLKVGVVDVTETFHKSRRCTIGKRFSRDEMDVTGDGHEEAIFIDEHVIDAQSDHAVFVGDLQWKAERGSGADMSDLLPGGLVFERTDVATKDLVCCYGIISVDGAVREHVVIKVCDEIF